MHTAEYINEVKGYCSDRTEQVCKVPERWPTYTSDSSFESSCCAAGCTLSMVDAVLTGQVVSKWSYLSLTL